jgi:uncharacterized protein
VASRYGIMDASPAAAQWRGATMGPKPKSLDAPLSDAETERLSAFLAAIKTPEACDFEAMDGLLAALIVGPEWVSPSEYLPAIFGGELPDENAFADQAQASDILSLIMRHSNVIAASFQREGLYLPWVVEAPGAGRRLAQRWSEGFMRGVHLRDASWARLIRDESELGSIVPMALLAGEVDPKWLAKKASAEKQEDLLMNVAAGLARCWRYFKADRLSAARSIRAAQTVRRSDPKVGRNEPCPCGSGRKYKQCCGKADEPSVH